MRRTFGRGAIRIGVDQTLAPVGMKIAAVILHDLAEKTPPKVSTRRLRILLRQPRILLRFAHILLQSC